MDINQSKNTSNKIKTPFNQFSEKLISLNLKKKKKKTNNLDISKSPSQKNYEIDEFDDLTIDNGSKSYIEENDDDNNHIDSIEKNQNDLMSLLNKLKTQNSILKKSTSNSINVNIMNNKFKFSFEGKKKAAKNKQTKNENFNVASKDTISFRNNKESSPKKDNNTNNSPKESKSFDEVIEKDEEIEKPESNINKEDSIKAIEEKKRLLELQEKEQREKIEKELREKVEKENKERIEKEIKDKILKEYREKIEREERERIEKEKKEKEEKEEKLKKEREQIEKELEERLKKEREQREKELEEKLQMEREEREKIQKELEEKLQKEREERERIERELKEKHEKEEKERIENELKAKQMEELRIQKENEEKKRLEILEKEKKIEEEKNRNVNEEKKIKNAFVEPAMDKPLTNTQESLPFAIDDIEEIDEESEHTNEKIKILQSQISSGMLSPSGRFDNNNSKQSKKEEDPSIKNVINTFLSPQKEEEEEKISIKQISIEEEKENPKQKEIERVKALREREKMELIKKTQPEEKIESNRSKKEEKKEIQKIIPQIEDIGKILTTSKNYNENEMIKIDKSKYTEITKIEVKEKPYLENSKDPPYGYLLQRRRKAFLEQSYFNDYILKEKNIIDQIKKISQNYQDILEESLKQFEQEKPFNSIFNAVMGHDNNFKEEMSEKLKLDSILKESQEKSDEDNTMLNFKQKMIGPIESLTNLAIYYSMSLNDSSIMKNLTQHFNYWRKIETDGDSFYRTFMFSLLEYYIFTKNNHEIQKIILAITRLSDDEIISNAQSVDFNQILVIFYFIYEQITKGNHYKAYKILLNAYELEDNSFDTAMTIYCRYAIYCNVDHLYNVYLRPKNSPYGGGENSARDSRANLDGSTTIDKVSPSTIIKFGYEPLKIVFSAIPFIFNVNLEIIALDGGLSMNGNKIKVIYSKFTDYSLNDLPIISIGYFLSSYHKIYTKAYQNKILKSSCEEFFSPEEFNEKGAVLREVYIDPKEEQTTCEKCNTQGKMIYFPRHFLSACGRCFLKDLEQILKCRAIDFAKEKYNNIECKFSLYNNFRLFKRHTDKRKSLHKRL